VAQREPDSVPRDSEPTSEDLERGWRVIQDQDAAALFHYECMRDGGDGPCGQVFDTRRALGSHQGRGHTAKAKRSTEGVTLEALATSIGKAVLRGEPIPDHLRRAVLLRIVETSAKIEKLAVTAEDPAVGKAARENGALARFILDAELATR
jgi:hypothetical protein